MHEAESMAERHSRVLARVAELSLTLAEDAQAGALAASDPAEKKDLVAAFDRAAGQVCRAVAIEAKLERDQRRDARQARADAGVDKAARVETRKRQVRAQMERRIFSELDPRQGQIRLADFEERLEDEALYDRFTDEEVEAHIDRLCAELGLTGEAPHDYVPRTCRARGVYVPSRELDRFFGPSDAHDEAFDGEDDEEEYDGDEFDDDEGDHAAEDDTAENEAAVSPSGGERREAPQGLLADGESDDNGPPEPPPAEDPGPAAAAAPEPPPQPPDPEPYLPPWERVPPNGRRHHGGGSGGPLGWMSG
jgi:hypothetical protein